MNAAAKPLELNGDRGRAAADGFDELYDREFDFVWRSLRRLGVPASSLDDAAQDCFVVVHRRLDSLRPDASVKAWLFAIALRVARNYRRTARRKPTTSLDTESAESAELGPFESAASAQARRTLQRFLDSLDEDRRAVFVLAELEELSAPDISEALGARVNTVYSRLRTARERFVMFLAEEAVANE